MKPICHLICGLPGAGKTTLARQIEAETGALRLSPDEWLLALGFGLYDEGARERVDALQWAMALQMLRGGGSVIWDKGFWARAERDRYRAEAQEAGAMARFYLLDAPSEELRKRLIARNAVSPPEQRVNPDDLDLRASWFEPYDEDEWAQAFSPPHPAARE